MKKINEHILSIISREEKGSILSYNILSNIAVNLVLGGASPEAVIEYIDNIIIDPAKRDTFYEIIN